MDDEAGLEAVQKVVDSLDDIYALQDPLVEPDVLRDILRDDRLHMLLQVGGEEQGTAAILYDDLVNPAGLTVFLLLYSLLTAKPFQLYDRISCTVMSPARLPPGDAVSRCRDAMEAIRNATGHKLQREKAYVLQLLSLPHMQVSGGGSKRYDCNLLMEVCLYTV